MCWSTWGQFAWQILISFLINWQRETMRTLQLSWTKCHLLVMRLLYPVNCFFVLSSNNKKRRKKKKTLPSVCREQNLCSVLTAILAYFQPVYRSWPLLLPLAVSVTHQCQPSYLLSLLGFYWPFVPWSWWGPKLCPWMKHYCCSQADNSFQN